MAKKEVKNEVVMETISDVSGVEPDTKKEESNEEVTETTSRIVQLETGELVNFGKSGKVIASYDVDTDTITFKTVPGKVISFKISDLPENVLKEATIYGLREKIKATLAPITANDIPDKIYKEIEALQAGLFVTRSSDSTTTVELDDFMKAFALINATGQVNTGTALFTIKEQFISVPELRPHWVNLNDVNVINEVLTYWDSLSRQEKAAQKRNTFVKTQASIIATGDLKV